MKIHTIKELEDFFNQDIPEVVVLNPVETIVDTNKFISSHIGYLKANSGNARYLPYYDRLIALKKKLDERNI